MRSLNKFSVGLLVAWHALALIALLLLLPQLKFNLPFWSLKDGELRPLVILLCGYAVSAMLPVAFRLARRPLALVGLITSILSIFALIFLYFLIARVDSARIVMAEVLAAALVLVPIGLHFGRLRVVGVAMLALAVAFALSQSKVQHHAQANNPRMDVSIMHSAFYNLRAVSYRDYIPAPAVRGGGISRIGDQFVLATGDGFLYLIGWPKGQDEIKVLPLPYRIPVNGDEFARDTTGGPWHTPREGDALSVIGEDAGTQVIAWWFRATDVLIQDLGSQVRVFASHYYWKHDSSCWVERVSMMEGARESLLRGAPGLAWRTLFESKPCLPIWGPGRKSGTPFCGHFGGGRMILRDPKTLLLTVGDFGFNGVASRWQASQDMQASYGKTIMIHLQDGSSEIFTSGNRNPQGLYMDPQGRIWNTEQGPQGGDELNLLKQGLNYGWPIVTYGVDYGAFAWPLNPKQGEHEGYEAPYYSWLPDVGVSNLVGVEKDLFPLWKGDLLVTSMVGQTLFRVRIRNDRVVYVEPLPMGQRVRDIAEGSDGRLALWEDDDNAIVSLRPAVGNSGEVAFATSCSGCHKVGDGTSHRIGPDLWGVLGRKAGSAGGYADYSAALHAFGGTWNRERLDNFIKNPQVAVPGTAMQFGGVQDAQVRANIIDFIKNSKKVVSR